MSSQKRMVIQSDIWDPDILILDSRFRGNDDGTFST